MNEPHIRFYRLPHGMDLPLPAYETVGSAGMDLRAAIGDSATVTIEAGRRMLVPTGLIAAIAPGFEGQVRPRSGLAFKHGVTCLNTPGTIDSDYRGELHVLLVNHGDETFAITRGMRIAQLVVAPVVRAVIIETDQLPEPTERNEGGFGSTGTA